MGCLYPNKAFRNRDGEVTFNRSLSVTGIGFTVPCGQCIECRLAHARSWAIRCIHESKMHAHNQFVTLTYDDAHMPEGRSLSRRDTQLFMKRLRKRFGKGVRVYGCGEYSPSQWRPHYHLLLFNLWLPDRKFYKMSPRGEPLYTSEILFELWPHGMNCIGEVTFDSAAYCAGYVTKKITGEKANEHYLRYAPDGQPYWLVPEFPIQSRKPGIGASFYAEFSSEIIDSDAVVINDILVRPPRFYDTRYELNDPEAFAALKRKRKRKALASKPRSYYTRRAREIILLRKQNLRSG